MKSLPIEEHWRPVVGYEGFFEVSSNGRVRSLPRMVPAGGGRQRRSSGRVLSQSAASNYPKVGLRVDGVRRTYNVHRIVAEAFLGPCPPGLEVLHQDGDRLDNRAANLRYGTRSQNNYDAVRHGTHFQAKKTHCPHGHEYTLENTIQWGASPHRRCRTCEDRRQQIRRQSRRAVA